MQQKSIEIDREYESLQHWNFDFDEDSDSIESFDSNKMTKGN